MWIFVPSYNYLLRLRYRIRITGREVMKKDESCLVLPNHQALVDPQIVFTSLAGKKRIRPVASELYFRNFLLRFVLTSFGSVKVSDLSAGSRDLTVLDTIRDAVTSTLAKGGSVLLYPSGQLASQGCERIFNKKSAWAVVSELPAGTRVIGVRVTGLWGSMWSKAGKTKTPPFFPVFMKGLGIILLNLFFLTPKRTVTIHLEDLTTDAIRTAKEGKKEFNLFLEVFYNQMGEEPVTKVPYFFLSF